MQRALLLAVLSAIYGACGGGSTATHEPSAGPVVPAEDPDDYPTGLTQQAGPPPAGLAVATFAGGCFWCIEAAFERVHGVRDAISGYTGGPEQSPSYDDVSNHRTQQAESVRVIYDPTQVTYAQLVDVFFRHIDATAVDGAFSDEGHQYRSVIFVASPEERATAEHAKAQLDASHRFDAPVATTIENAGVFWVAETYHQNFYRTHPHRFTQYHEASGRREYLRAHWGPTADY